MLQIKNWEKIILIVCLWTAYVLLLLVIDFFSEKNCEYVDCWWTHNKLWLVLLTYSWWNKFAHIDFEDSTKI